MERQVLTVTALNNYLKNVFESMPALENIYLRGELSNYKIYPSGHHYFTLKDENSTLKCVMFKSSAVRLRMKPENGMKVICNGSISVYPRDGVYQLYCSSITVDGLGDLHIAFEQLKQKLNNEGLFDPEHKKPLPSYPNTIAIVTSPAGAAIHDMLRILNHRYPIAKVKLFSVRVQGKGASDDIIEAIDYINEYSLADVIIIGRGGGSIEDLWAFNDEILARTIYDSQIPVISAVGHEPDYTISDFVADKRAATPSNAAEIVVPDVNEILGVLKNYNAMLNHSMEHVIQQKKKTLNIYESYRVLREPTGFLDEKKVYLDHLTQRLFNLMDNKVQRSSMKVAELSAALNAMSPLRVLGRGYSIVKNSKDEIVTDASKVNVDDEVTISLEKGKLECLVKEVING